MAHRTSDTDTDTGGGTGTDTGSSTDTDTSTDTASEATSGADELTRETVLGRIDRVTDPELDRSIVELGYVDEIEIDGSAVFVRFKLPTAWCSPTFAWMMATGIRDECEKLSGVSETTIELIDHMHVAEVNEGVNSRLAFEDAFEDASEGIEETREGLDRKARLARQYKSVETLRDAGMKPEQVVSLTPADVGFAELPAEGGAIGADTDAEEVVTISLDDGALYVEVPRKPLARYVAKAIDTGVLNNSDEGLFATPEGDPLTIDEFDLVQHRARSAYVNQSGQGGVCASLHEARYGIRIDEPAD